MLQISRPRISVAADVNAACCETLRHTAADMTRRRAAPQGTATQCHTARSASGRFERTLKSLAKATKCVEVSRMTSDKLG